MRVYFLIPVLAVLLSACKKNLAGGNAEIKGRTLHHSKVIANSIVYIKYNAQEFPGKDVLKYDTYVRADAGGNYSFKCYKGQYYLYATGVDTLATPVPVDGGIPVRVRAKEVVEADIAVSEVH